MVVQSSFVFNYQDYKFPSYKKCYVVYAYDTEKYRKIWKKLKDLAIKFKDETIYTRVNPYRVLEHCYLKDKNGKKKYLGDSKHIFRYKTLHLIYEEIAKEVLQGQSLLPFDNLVFKKNGLNLYLNVYKKEEYCWFDRKIKNYKKFLGNKFIIVEAEIENTGLLPINERLKIHIELLRQLRQGVKLKHAVKIARKAGK